MTEKEMQETIDREVTKQLAVYYEKLKRQEVDAAKMQEAINKEVDRQLSSYYEKLAQEKAAAAEAEKNRPKELSLKNVYKNSREIKNTWYSKDVIKDALEDAIDHLEGYTPDAPDLNGILSRFLNKVDMEIQHPTTFEKAKEKREQKDAEIDFANM